MTKEKFIKYYIDENHTMKETELYFNITHDKIKKLIKEFDCHKSKELQNINASKSFQSKTPEEIKNIKNKAKQTNLKKYGTENPNQNKEIREKARQTNLKKYGVENPLQSKEIQEKIKQTNLEKYGSEYVGQNNNIRNKIKQTCLERYNSSSYLGSDNIIKVRAERNKKYFQHLYGRTVEQTNIASNKNEFTNFIKSLQYEDRTIENISKLLNYSTGQIDKLIIKYELQNDVNYYSNRSKYEDEIIEFLKENNIINIEHNKRTYLDGQEIDIYLPDYKIGIEFNGNYWHSDAIEKFQDHRGRSKYHQNKSLLAESKGIFLFHIFEYEWKDDIMKIKIKNRLKSLLGLDKNIIYGRNCTVKEIGKDIKQAFLDSYHLQGNDKSSIFYGLYYNDQLVSVMTFCKARFTKADWELSRYCTINDTNVIGGANKLFKYFTNNIMKIGETCVTYNDFTKTKGVLYEKLNFKYCHLAQPNYIWINFFTNDILTRYQCRIKNETEIMHNNGYNRIADCGNKVWIYAKQ